MAAYHCADRRFPRSLPTVRGEVRRSPALAQTQPGCQLPKPGESDRRYLSEGSMALLTQATKEVATAQLLPA